MRHVIKFSIVAVAAASAGGLVTGIAEGATTTTAPVVLCVAPLTRTVSAPPASGVCPSADKTVKVGSAADLAVLAHRMDTAETNIGSLTTSGSATSAQVDSLQNELSADENTIRSLENELSADYQAITTIGKTARALSDFAAPQLRVRVVTPPRRTRTISGSM